MGGVGCLVLCGILVNNFTEDWTTNGGFLNQPEDLKEFFLNYKRWSGSLLTILSVFLISTFIFVLRLLKEILPDSLTSYRNVIAKLFGVFIISYVLRTCFQWYYGNYYKIV